MPMRPPRWRRSCCSRRPAPRSISSAISRCVGRNSANWSAPSRASCRRRDPDTHLSRSHCSKSKFFLNGWATIVGGSEPTLLDPRRPPMVSRVEPTPFAAWWWTVDRLMLAALITLMLGGIVLSLAASPPVANRLGLEPFYFVNRHVLFLIPALMLLLATSLLSARNIRRMALVIFIVSLMLIVATLLFGAEVKGARRWIVIFGVNIQPSEFLKPAFVILIAWLFGESARRPEMPANSMALALLLVVVTLLVLQPDFGQTMLIMLVWGTLFFHAGKKEQRAPNQQDQHGLSEIGLQHQRAHGSQQERQRGGIRRHLRP